MSRLKDDDYLACIGLVVLISMAVFGFLGLGFGLAIFGGFFRSVGISILTGFFIGGPLGAYGAKKAVKKHKEENPQ